MDAAVAVETIVTTGVNPGSAIEVEGVPNLRDLGGWATPNGKVVSGQVYRSAEFSALGGPAAAEFASLGIRTVYDLRTAGERDANANVVPTGTEYITRPLGVTVKPGPRIASVTRTSSGLLFLSLIHI